MPAFFNGVFGHKPTTGDTWRRRVAREQAASCTGQTCCMSTVMGNRPMAEPQVQGRWEVPQPQRGMCSQGRAVLRGYFPGSRDAMHILLGLGVLGSASQLLALLAACWCGLQIPW